jgi:tetrathionate reductase subunit B
MTDIAKQPASRRSVVKALAAGLAALGAALASALPARRSQAKGEEAKRQYAMVIDVRRCIGCHACTVACKAEFDVPLGHNRAWVEYVEKGEYPNVGKSFPGSSTSRRASTRTWARASCRGCATTVRSRRA